MNCKECGHPLFTKHVGYKGADRIEACVECGTLYSTKELNELRDNG